MDRKPSREQFADLLGRMRLSDEEYVSLQRRSNRSARPRAWWSRPVVQRLAVACVGVLAVAAVLLWAVLPGRGALPGETTHEVARRVSSEVITNHIHPKPLDLETGSVRMLADRFEQLDFRIQDSRYLSGQGLKLLGGRYCTLQGRIATQILFRGPGGEAVSHYQAAYHPDVYGDIPEFGHHDAPMRITDRGYAVEIWREQGLLMAKAHPL